MIASQWYRVYRLTGSGGNFIRRDRGWRNCAGQRRDKVRGDCGALIDSRSKRCEATGQSSCAGRECDKVRQGGCAWCDNLGCCRDIWHSDVLGIRLDAG